MVGGLVVKVGSGLHGLDGVLCFICGGVDIPWVCMDGGDGIPSPRLDSSRLLAAGWIGLARYTE